MTWQWLVTREHAPPRTARALVRAALSSGEWVAAVAVSGLARGREREAISTMLTQHRGRRLLVAGAANTPATALAIVADAADASLRRRIASHPNACPNTLSSLSPAAAADPGLAERLARHPAATDALIDSLLNIEGPSAPLVALATRPQLNAAQCARLFERLPAGERWRLGMQANAGRALIARLSVRADRRMLSILAKHAEASWELRARALRSKHLEVRRALAMRSVLTAQELSVLASDPHWSVRRVIASRPLLPASHVVQYVTDESPLVRQVLAARGDLPAVLLATLAEDSDRWVRQAVARHPSVSKALLRQLARDRDPDVRRAVGRHANTPPQLLSALSEDPVAWVRAAVAHRVDLPASLARRLARDASLDVLSGVARAPNTPLGLLTELSRHSEPDVRRALLGNRRLPRPLVTRLSADAYALTRSQALAHPRLSLSRRWAMRSDPDERIRGAVYGWFAARQCA